MRIFQLRIPMATPTYCGRTKARTNSCVCTQIHTYECVCVCVYNKTQIQMAFYATCLAMHGRRAPMRVAGWCRQLGKSSKHVSHVFHYVRQTAWHGRLITATQRSTGELVVQRNYTDPITMLSTSSSPISMGLSPLPSYYRTTNGHANCDGRKSKSWVDTGQ